MMMSVPAVAKMTCYVRWLIEKMEDGVVASVERERETAR